MIAETTASPTLDEATMLWVFEVLTAEAIEHRALAGQFFKRRDQGTALVAENFARGIEAARDELGRRYRASKHAPRFNPYQLEEDCDLDD